MTDHANETLKAISARLSAIAEKQEELSAHVDDIRAFLVSPPFGDPGGQTNASKLKEMIAAWDSSGRELKELVGWFSSGRRVARGVIWLSGFLSAAALVGAYLKGFKP